MTIFKGNRKFPNPITVTDDPKSHTLALQQVIEALNIGQRRTKEINSSYVRVHELVDVGLIEIVGNQLKLTNTGAAAVAGGATTLAALTDVDLTGLSDGDILVYDAGTATWVVQAPTGGAVTGADMYDVSLNDLSDVAFYLPNHGDVLTYDANLGVWDCHPLDDTIEISMYFSGRPTNSRLMFQYTPSSDFYFPADFSGAYGDIGTNATATTTLTVARDGTTIGTISISTGGVFTFATVSNQQQLVLKGEKITITNQSSADATAADISVSLVGIIEA